MPIQKRQELISVIVISYNSEAYIVEALESIRKQTYKNLELIISDDGSNDNTTTIVKKWLSLNNNRFKKYTVLTSKQNSGITANVNRGVQSASGQFIKLIAADDILLDNCIEDLCDYCLNNELQFCFSRALPFSETLDKKYINDKIHDDRVNYNYFFGRDQGNQYKALLRLTCPLSFVIGGFYSKKLIEKIGVFDEKYEMMDDYPFLVKIADLGLKFKLLNKYTTKYRIRAKDNLETFKLSKRYQLHYKNLLDFRRNEILPRMHNRKMFFSEFYLNILIYLLEKEYENRKHVIKSIMRNLRRIKQLIMSIGTR